MRRKDETLSGPSPNEAAYLAISRQVRRAYFRQAIKNLHQPKKYGTVVSSRKLELRRERQRLRLERQSRREKSGFYEGTMSVAMALDGRGSGRLHRGAFA